MPLLSEMEHYTSKFHTAFCYTLELYLLEHHFTVSTVHTTKYLQCENTQYYVKHIIYAHKHYKKPQNLNY